MISYDYYINTYKGHTVPSSDFSFYERKASKYVETCLKAYAIYETDEYTEINKGLCACEIMDCVYNYENTNGSGVSEESDGSASIKYSKETAGQITNKILTIFGSYFDYFRGGRNA